MYRLGSDIRVPRADVSRDYLSYHKYWRLTDIYRYAEMDKVAKNKISHRFRALEKLKKWLEES